LEPTNPALIVAGISGFGRVGPFAGVKGYEGIVMAKLGFYEGFSRMTRRPGPTFVSAPFATYCAAQTTVHGILGALIERETSGRGQQVDTNLAQGVATLDCWNWTLRFIADRYPEAFHHVESFDADGNPNAHQVMTLLIASTLDGRWLQFAQLQPDLFASLLRVLNMTDLMDDPEWSGLPIYESAKKRTLIWERLLEAAGRLSLADWEAVFDSEPDVFAELFRSGREVLDHPALSEPGWVSTTEDPAVGPLRQLGPIARLVGEEWTPAPSPAIGKTPDGDPAHRSTAPVGSGIGATTALPLAGITVVDLCVWYAAPYATTLLTDLGARVIHVESLTGDPIRPAAGFPEAGGLKVMQGKESIAVDLSTPEGRSIVRQLVLRSSAVLHGFRGGVAERMELDATTLRDLNPNLVYVDATGYGVGGPYAHRPSFAPSIGVAAGIAIRNIGNEDELTSAKTLGERKERVTRLRAATSSISANADGLSALGTASALLLGLFAAKRGAAPHLETTMLSTTASVIYDVSLAYPGKSLPQPDADLLGLSALYRLYEAKDGWVFLAVTKDSEWRALTEAFAPFVALEADSRFGIAAHRRVHDAELAEVLGEVFLSNGVQFWEALLTAGRVACVEAAQTSTEALLMSDDVGRRAGYVTDVVHPVFDTHPRLAPVVRFSRSSTQALAGCLAGQHTDSLLEELGYAASAIQDLRARNIVA
jgi:crotonobetainyl-CoA:carnitine CoA-transferase CaiB-like acyl-CoA transferase